MALRLSIIIPFYNVERFISECLDSVFDQDIPLSDYEVICVNDGSPDHSRDIVLQYMERFPNLRLIEHEKNKKLGAARNTGRTIAQGRYIWNVDSDDKIVPNCLSGMLKICEENDLDVLEFGAIQFSQTKQKELPHVPSTSGVEVGVEYLDRLNAYQVSRMCPVWNKMIRRDFLEGNGIFSPEINMGEDIPYSFRILTLAKRFSVVSDSYYLYRVNDDSLTGSNWKPTPEVLYEKCFVNPKMVYDVAQKVPADHPSARSSFLQSAKYTLDLFPKYLKEMSAENQARFKTLCRKSFFKNRYVFTLMGQRRSARFCLWLAGLRKTL
jgi:Glycosyltransferases involved in cell wall biogenesis